MDQQRKFKARKEVRSLCVLDPVSIGREDLAGRNPEYAPLGQKYTADQAVSPRRWCIQYEVSLSRSQKKMGPASRHRRMPVLIFHDIDFVFTVLIRLMCCGTSGGIKVPLPILRHGRINLTRLFARRHDRHHAPGNTRRFVPLAMSVCFLPADTGAGPFPP